MENTTGFFRQQVELMVKWEQHLKRNGVNVDSETACRMFIVRYSQLFRDHWDHRVLHLAQSYQPHSKQQQ